MQDASPTVLHSSKRAAERGTVADFKVRKVDPAYSTEQVCPEFRDGWIRPLGGRKVRLGACLLMYAGAGSGRDPDTHAASPVGIAFPPSPRRAQEKLTPLHNAANNGQVEVVKMLLEQGDDVEAEDTVMQEGGLCACVLMYASAGSARDPATHAASSLGAALPPPLRRAPTAAAQEKCTPLHLAASKGHVEVVKVLLERGANVEAGNNVRLGVVRLGWVYVCSCTPVHVALAIPPRTLRARFASRSHRRRAAHRRSSRRCTMRRTTATWRW